MNGAEPTPPPTPPHGAPPPMPAPGTLPSYGALSYPPVVGAAPRRGGGVASCLMTLTLLASMGLNVVLFFMLLGALGSAGGLSPDGVTEHLRSGNASATQKIAVIPVKGVIASGGGSALFGPQADIVEKILQDLGRVKDDSNVVAVVLEVNSPGGGITDCDRIHHEILELRKARPNLKMVSFMSDVAASGGYYVSAPCDRIVASHTTITGSIGVIMSFMNLEGLFEKIGYREEVIKSGDHKDLGSMGRPMTDEERKILQTMLMEMYDRFVQVVADGRRMDPAKVRDLADGRVYTGAQAKANGLVDELGYFEDAVEAAKKLAGAGDAKVIEYRRPPSLRDLLMAESKPSPADAVIAGELGRLVGRRGGFYYLWTLDGGTK